MRDPLERAGDSGLVASNLTQEAYLLPHEFCLLVIHQLLTLAALWRAAVALDVAAGVTPKPVGALKVAGGTGTGTVKGSVAAVPMVLPLVSRAVTTAVAAPLAKLAA